MEEEPDYSVVLQLLVQRKVLKVSQLLTLSETCKDMYVFVHQWGTPYPGAYEKEAATQLLDAQDAAYRADRRYRDLVLTLAGKDVRCKRSGCPSSCICMCPECVSRTRVAFIHRVGRETGFRSALCLKPSALKRKSVLHRSRMIF